MEVNHAKEMPLKHEFVIQKPAQLIASGDLMINGLRALNHAEVEINPVQDQ